MSLVDSVRDALRLPEAHESQGQVHEVVARRFAELTPGASVRTTGYFNHSWAPDLVVASRDQQDRWVYLRFDVRDPSFSDDLRYLSVGRPVFVDLLAANPDETAREGGHFDLEAAVATHQDQDVLVTEVAAIERFDDLVQANRSVQAATKQIVLGGHGVIDEPAATDIVASWAKATSAVAGAKVDALREALDDVENYLSRVASLDLESGLRTDWIAAGQSAESFPGREDWELTDRPPWEIARVVLALVHDGAIVPDGRWAEIARTISVGDLGHELYQLGEHFEGAAVNDLARAGLKYWTAQYAYVPPLESDSIERFNWSLGGYSLAVNLINRIAYFTDAGRKWSRKPRAPLPEAQPRMELLRRSEVLGVGITTTEETMSMELRPTATMALGQRLEQVVGQGGDAAWRAARINSIDLQVAGTSSVAHIDFGRSVVRTTAPIPLRTYVLLLAEYVAGLEPEELNALTRELDGPT